MPDIGIFFERMDRRGGIIPRMPPPHHRSGRLLPAIFTCYCTGIGLIILIADSGHGPDTWPLISTIQGADKVGHAVLFGIMALLADLTLRGRGIPRGKPVVPMGSAAVALFAIAEEFSQRFIPGRTFDTGDLAAGLAGIAAAAILAWLLKLRGRWSFGDPG
jgi:hypothetical protein